MENRPDWGNTAQAATAGLGSKGLKKMNCFDIYIDTVHSVVDVTTDNAKCLGTIFATVAACRFRDIVVSSGLNACSLNMNQLVTGFTVDIHVKYSVNLGSEMKCYNTFYALFSQLFSTLQS